MGLYNTEYTTVEELVEGIEHNKVNKEELGIAMNGIGRQVFEEIEMAHPLLRDYDTLHGGVFISLNEEYERAAEELDAVFEREIYVAFVLFLARRFYILQNADKLMPGFITARFEPEGIKFCAVDGNAQIFNLDTLYLEIRKSQSFDIIHFDLTMDELDLVNQLVGLPVK